MTTAAAPAKVPPLDLTATVERKQPRLPRFVVIPARTVASWKITDTTTIEGTINGSDLGRRSIKKWDTDRWFVDLPERICRRASVEVGDQVHLNLRIASEALPEELVHVLAASPKAHKAWDHLNRSARRMIREYVASAKLHNTRLRRASLSLGLKAS
jgi:Bacteriocin-protection, YdeI or OmpD-Associated/Domain of unknown function (DUF1905)